MVQVHMLSLDELGEDGELVLFLNELVHDQHWTMPVNRLSQSTPEKKVISVFQNLLHKISYDM